MHGRGIFDWIEFALRFDDLAYLFVFIDGNGLNPGHNLSFLCRPVRLVVCDETETDKTAGPAKPQPRRGKPASDCFPPAEPAAKQSTPETRSASPDNPASSIRLCSIAAAAI